MNRVIDQLLQEATILGMMNEASKATEKAHELGLQRIGSAWGMDGKVLAKPSSDGKELIFTDKEAEKEAKAAEEKYPDEKKGTSGQTKSGKELELVGDAPDSDSTTFDEKETLEKLKEAGFGNNKLPDSIKKSDPSIAQALKFGFKANEDAGYKPAPGNAGSLFNENFSVIGVNMLDAMAPVKPTADELASIFTKLYGKTAALKDIKSEDQIKTAAEAAINKHDILSEIKENSDGVFGDNTVTHSYYGSSTSLKQQYDLIMDMKKDPESNLYDDKGQVMDFVPKDFMTYVQVRGWNNPETGEKFTKEETETLLSDQSREGVFNFVALAALNGGGGGNPSDTTSILQDGKNLSFVGWSDKTSLEDQQANSTPAKLAEVMSEAVEYLEENGWEFNKEARKTIKETLSNMSKKFAQSEKRLASAALGPATEIAQSFSENNEENMAAVMDILNDPKIAGEGGGTNSEKRRKRIDSIGAGKEGGKVLASFPGQLINPDSIPTWNTYLSQTGWEEGTEPTREQKVQAWLLLKSDDNEVTYKDKDGNEFTASVGEVFSSGVDNSIMGKITDNIKESGTYTPNNEKLLSDYLSVVEEARQESLSELRDSVGKLNEEHIVDENGEKFQMGNVMAGFDLMEKLHLYMIDGKNAPGLYAYGGVKLIAGNDRVTGENMAKCLGTKNSEDLLKRIKVRPPQPDGPTFKYRGKDVSENEMQRATVTSKDKSKAAKTKDGKYIYIGKDGNYLYLDQKVDDPKQESPNGTKGLKQLGVVTGQKSLVYYEDDEGNETPIGQQILRSKQGVAGKLDTTYIFAPDLQKCLAKNSGNTNESISYDHIQTLLEMASKV
jgi:hypothetical protein